MNPAIEERFWQKVQKTDTCWLWTGARRANGYGAFGPGPGRGKQTWQAHRFAFVLVRGEVPAGMDVCHACDERLCVRPDHLFLGTRADNMRDAVTKGRVQHGSQRPNAKLTDEKVAALRKAQAAGASYSKLAKMFGVSIGVAFNVTKRKAWKHVE